MIKYFCSLLALLLCTCLVHSSNSPAFSSNATSANMDERLDEYFSKRIERYFSTSKFLDGFEDFDKRKVEKTLRAVLEERFWKSRWPGDGQLAIAEQFFWKLSEPIMDGPKVLPSLRKDSLIRKVFGEEVHGSVEDFETFVEPYL